MDYKDTLHLPKTDFPMKANLAKREPEFLANWQSEELYQKIMKKNEGKTPFILHDGPPYANGHIHFGHILNKVLKDIIVKYKNLRGFYSPYIPGWDCHGLPIELGAVKELQKKEKDPERRHNPIIKRNACRDYAHQFINDQREQFKRLGIFSDWDNPYLTLDFKYEADIAREFIKLYNQGFIYQGKKPIYWCNSCRTALAEAEVEYENLNSPSIYVKFEVSNPKDLGIDSKKPISFLIWTTTPWTLPANLALAIGEKINYAIVETKDNLLVIAKELIEEISKDIDLEDHKIIKEISGKDLDQLKLITHHPFLDRSSPVLIGHHVSLEAGTGVVHIAPGHGQDDYFIGQKNGLEVLCPVDHAGRLTEEAINDLKIEELKSIVGLKVHEANKIIVKALAENGILLSSSDLRLEHSYPHCWRCKNPVIFRATKQWFFDLEHEDLRSETLKAINGKVKWIPGWGHTRIFGMIENRPDWCLSRQRIWGVPITVHFCKDCEKPILNEEIGEYIAKKFDEHGADIWWENDEALLPENTKCECGGKEFTKEKSILDVWFDSGVSHAAVLKRRENLTFPANLYLEGSDQHRGWFHSSILTSMATNKIPPYHEVLTHGFVVDGKGKKYSKSAKNYLPPDKVINESGAEILRLWVAAEDYRNDIRVSNEILKVLSEIYRKIRNTSRFMLGVLNDFNQDQDYIEVGKREEIDLYALSRLNQLIQKVTKAYDEYEFHTAHHALNNFFTVELSSRYLDILKDRLYCDKRDGVRRKSAISTVYDIINKVIPLMSPILSFTAEEIWSFIPNPSKAESVFLAEWPEVKEDQINLQIEEKWDRIWKIRDEVLRSLETARKEKKIGHPLDAKVLISAEGETLEFIKSYTDQWTQILITSQVEIKDDLKDNFVDSEKIKGLKISIGSAEGKKCARCWNYDVKVGESADHPEICPRCVEAVS
jgi:isoleucyl-tRNA synthetase